MNVDLDREVTAVNRSSRPVNGDLGWGPWPSAGRRLAVGWPSAGRTLFSSEENGFEELTLYFIPSQLNKLFH